MFELLLLRVLLGRFGVKTPVRVATIILVPAAALFRSISSLQGHGNSLALTAVAFLFVIYACLDLVGGRMCTCFFGELTGLLAGLGNHHFVREAATELEALDLYRREFEPAGAQRRSCFLIFSVLFRSFSVHGFSNRQA